MIQKAALICFLLALVFAGNAQRTSFLPKQGILPFSGAKFFQHGMGGEEIEIKLAEDIWISNRLPVNTEFEMKLIRPTGLTIAEDGNFHPGVEVLMLNTKKDTLAFVPNIFGDENEGVDAELFKSLTLSLAFNEMSKPGDTCQILTRFFDTRSANYLLVDFLVIIADPSLPLAVTNSTHSVSSEGNYHGIASGVEMQKVDVTVEEGSKSPFFEIRLSELSEITEKDYREGKSAVWVLDGELNDKLLEKNNISAKTTGDKTDMVIKIPLRINGKYVRFRWESKDGKKVIDFVGMA